MFDALCTMILSFRFWNRLCSSLLLPLRLPPPPRFMSHALCVCSPQSRAGYVPLKFPKLNLKKQFILNPFLLNTFIRSSDDAYTHQYAMPPNAAHANAHVLSSQATRHCAAQVTRRELVSFLPFESRRDLHKRFHIIEFFRHLQGVCSFSVFTHKGNNAHVYIQTKAIYSQLKRMRWKIRCWRQHPIALWLNPASYCSGLVVWGRALYAFASDVCL